MKGYEYGIFNDQSFSDTLTNNIVSFEQLGPDVVCPSCGLIAVRYWALVKFFFFSLSFFFCV